MSKNKLNAHLTQSLKESIYKIMEEESTSARNLEQFRERQASNRAERQARGQEINAAKRERTAQINAKTAELGSRDNAMTALNKSADFQRLSGTASRGQGQQNTFGGENQRTETSSGVSRMARGADGRPVSSYVNQTTGAQARVAKDVASGKLPASFGQYQGNRLPMDLAKERENAGNAAFDKSVEDDLDIENASGMNRSDLESKANEVVAQRTLNIDHRLRGDDIRTHGQMPPGAVGSNTQAVRIAKETERRRMADIFRGNNRSVNLNPVGRGRDFRGGNAQQVGQLSEPTLTQPRPRPSNLVDPSTQRQDERDAQQRDSQFSKPTVPKPVRR